MVLFGFWLCSAKTASGHSTEEVAQSICVAVSSAKHHLGKCSLSEVKTKEFGV